MSVRWWMAALLLLAMMPEAARAADTPLPPFPDAQLQQQWQRAEELARKSVDGLLRSFELFKNALPEYGAPYLDPRGNIVIPRKHRSSPPLGVPVPMPEPQRT